MEHFVKYSLLGHRHLLQLSNPVFKEHSTDSLLQRAARSLVGDLGVLC